MMKHSQDDISAMEAWLTERNLLSGVVDPETALQMQGWEGAAVDDDLAYLRANRSLVMAVHAARSAEVPLDGQEDGEN